MMVGVRRSPVSNRRCHFDPDSTAKPKMPRARPNPGAAKASDCEVSKSFCAIARRCYEALHPLPALLIDVRSEAEIHRLRCGRVAPRAFCRSQLRKSELKPETTI